MRFLFQIPAPRFLFSDVRTPCLNDPLSVLKVWLSPCRAMGRWKSLGHCPQSGWWDSRPHLPLLLPGNEVSSVKAAPTAVTVQRVYPQHCDSRWALSLFKLLESSTSLQWWAAEFHTRGQKRPECKQRGFKNNCYQVCGFVPVTPARRRLRFACSRQA